MFSESNWRSQCADMAKVASARCGQSHDVYVKSFSGSVSAAISRFTDAEKALAINIACEWDYATYDEIAESDNYNAMHGLCSHGIDPNCCPVGCGDLDCYHDYD